MNDVHHVFAGPEVQPRFQGSPGVKAANAPSLAMPVENLVKGNHDRLRRGPFEAAVHHTDVDFDVTTALRFHPVEIALSMLWKIAVVLALGASPWAVVLFEVTLNGCAMFNHANIALPLWLDRVVRLLIVTPDMHRVHHSIHSSEHDSNYGFNLSLWDRLFKTYTAQPRDGHLGMTIGQKNHLNDNPKKLLWSLMLPFMSTKHTSTQKKLKGK